MSLAALRTWRLNIGSIARLSDLPKILEAGAQARLVVPPEARDQESSYLAVIYKARQLSDQLQGFLGPCSTYLLAHIWWMI